MQKKFKEKGLDMGDLGKQFENNSFGNAENEKENNENEK